MRRSPSAALEHHAAVMRAHPTPSERVLWSAIRGGRLGASFQRQVIIGGRIVDFCAKRERLVVEVDGGYHAGRERADARRDRELKRAGYRVLHLSGEMVLGSVEQAVAVVRAALGG